MLVALGRFGDAIALMSGLAGALGERHGIRTIGYVPRDLPSGGDADPRYGELVRTEGGDFSPREPLSYWNDLLRAGVLASQVTAVGIGGGQLAAAEYAIALALGGTLGILRGSGRAADEILAGHCSVARGRGQRAG